MNNIKVLYTIELTQKYSNKFVICLIMSFFYSWMIEFKCIFHQLNRHTVFIYGLIKSI